jgi:hypothetical protein
VDGPVLMRQTREFRPDMPIIHIAHQGGAESDLFPDVVNLREPVSPERLMMTVRSLLSLQPASGRWAGRSSVNGSLRTV